MAKMNPSNPVFINPVLTFGEIGQSKSSVCAKLIASLLVRPVVPSPDQAAPINSKEAPHHG